MTVSQSIDKWASFPALDDRMWQWMRLGCVGWRICCISLGSNFRGLVGVSCRVANGDVQPLHRYYHTTHMACQLVERRLFRQFALHPRLEKMNELPRSSNITENYIPKLKLG